MKFLELFLTHIRIKMRPTKQEHPREHVHRNMWIYKHICVLHKRTHAHTHIQSIPVGGVSTGDLIDCAQIPKQQSKTSPFKETGLFYRSFRLRAPHSRPRTRSTQQHKASPPCSPESHPTKIRASLKTGS